MYNKKIALFMILLVLSISINISFVFAQSDDIPNPDQACDIKGEETDSMIELLDSDIIKNLERIARLAHTIAAGWSVVKGTYNTIILGLYAAAFGFGCVWCETKAIALENYKNAIDCPFCGGTMGKFIHYVATCQLPSQTGVDNVGDATYSLGNIGACNMNVPFTGEGNKGYNIGVGPYDNIYTAMACLCLPGILFNLRKLKLIYKTNDCCLEQACKNGLSTEPCEKQKSEALCMEFQGGAALSTLFGIVQSLAWQFVSKSLVGQYTLEIPYLIGTIESSANVYFEVLALQNVIEKLQDSFSEPNCKDLGFDKIKDDARDDFKHNNCKFRGIDLDADGILDTQEYICN